MTRRRGTGFDPRREPDEAKTGEPHHIDRVFRSAARSASTPPAQSPAEPRSPLPANPRAAHSDVRESDTALRRQLSRLERQLADAQRELASKDEELAGVLEKQLLAAAAVTSMQEQLRTALARAEQLAAQLAAVSVLQQRAQQSVANAEDLAAALAHEREQRELLERRMSELAVAVATDRGRWIAERAKLEAQYDAALATAVAEATLAAQQRDQLWENTVAQLRQQLKEAQIELAEARDARGRLEADKSSSHEQLAAAAREVLALSDEARALRDRVEAAEAAVRPLAIPPKSEQG